MTLLDTIKVYTASDLAGLSDARDCELVDGELVERHTSMESSRIASKDNGFPLGWVVQPLDQTVTVHRPRQPPANLVPGQEITAEPVRPALQGDVALSFRTNAKP